MTAAELFQSVWSNWQAVAIAAAVLSILFTSIAYSLATLFKLKSLQLWVKDELYQALASAFIVGAAVIIITAISSFSCSLLGGCAAGKDHMDVAITIMDTMKENVITQVQYMFDLSMRVGMITEMGKYYDFSVGNVACLVGLCSTATGFSWYYWAGGSMILDSLDYAFGLLIPVISSFIAQLYVLQLIKTALFPSLLAMGIILRTFFFTRKVGGLLMAIALALYTIYPLMYIMLQPYFTFTPHDFYYPENDVSATIMCGGSFVPHGDADHPFCIGIPGTLTYIIPGLPTSAANTGEATFMFKNGCRNNGDCLGGSTCENINGQKMCHGPPGSDYGSDVYAGMLSPYNGVLPTVGYLLVPGVFLPLLIILVTISFIKVLSPQLGGDIEITGLTRFI